MTWRRKKEAGPGCKHFTTRGGVQATWIRFYPWPQCIAGFWLRSAILNFEWNLFGALWVKISDGQMTPHEAVAHSLNCADTARRLIVTSGGFKIIIAGCLDGVKCLASLDSELQMINWSAGWNKEGSYSNSFDCIEKDSSGAPHVSLTTNILFQGSIRENVKLKCKFCVIYNLGVLLDIGVLLWCLHSLVCGGK